MSSYGYTDSVSELARAGVFGVLCVVVFVAKDAILVCQMKRERGATLAGV